MFTAIASTFNPPLGNYIYIGGGVVTLIVVVVVVLFVLRRL